MLVAHVSLKDSASHERPVRICSDERRSEDCLFGVTCVSMSVISFSTYGIHITPPFDASQVSLFEWLGAVIYGVDEFDVVPTMYECYDVRYWPVLERVMPSIPPR